MTTPLAAAPRLVLADRVFRADTRAGRIARDAGLIVAGVGLTAGLAQLAVPLWPVPITGQSLAVLLVGATLGTVRGGLTMLAYALVGLVGLPVFSDGSAGAHVLLGPTGGYIVGFIASAALVGWLAERAWDRKLVKAGLTFLAGTVTTFAFGLPWLAVALGLNLDQTLQGGLYPFIIGGIVKAAVAAGILPLAWKLTDRR
jgi:biotin transport system substrate-specific component